ncbi:PAS domain S-box protein [Sphingomonas sp. G124]|uniref:Sensor protein FixL n=1 Tax=Sphingomonas cremea TaxID=2904799 RepID=A0A9X1QM25_9SPHN|nr:PAS domain-containing sensor histidine kinase [Sphingomonas cremea]MCF2514532.1 PAS domain S-box protein [Sphingomonas cremea]
MDEAGNSGPIGFDESEAHLRSILATVPDAMVVIDELGIILSFSAAAEKMFGYLETEVVGENVEMLMPSPDRERHDGYLANYRQTGERKIIGIGRVTTARHRDGYTFPIELSIGEAWLGEKRIFTGFIHDITHRQEAESRLQDLQSELAHVGRVSEMGTLASSLAHELNQPLTAIANYCEGARELLARELDEETTEIVREALEDAAKEAVRAGQIVRRLRDFISHGDAERRVESLSRLVTEANALALVGSREHGIEVQLRLDSIADSVFVDRIQIQQVLTNLIRNAIDAMLDSPFRSLTVQTECKPKGFVTVSVVDTGSGISDEIASHLFQPFITTKKTGMGIGLSLCRTIVEDHGGRIWFEPVAAGGTAFRFTIPTAGAEE